jgi:hypothetical protein
MGGLGSGERPRKSTVEESLSIDVWDMQRRRLITPGTQGELRYGDSRAGRTASAFSSRSRPRGSS